MIYPSLKNLEIIDDYPANNEQRPQDHPERDLLLEEEKAQYGDIDVTGSLQKSSQCERDTGISIHSKQSRQEEHRISAYNPDVKVFLYDAIVLFDGALLQDNLRD